MKKLITILLLAPVMSFAQVGVNTQSLSGEITIPAFQSIKVELLNPAGFKFETPEDIASPKIISALYKVTVISTVPWVVNVSSASPFLSNRTSNDQKMPISSLELRANNGIFSPLTIAPVTLLKSYNENILNIFYIDVKVKAAIEFGSGKFNADLLFSISPD